MPLRIELRDLAKSFNRRTVFQHVTAGVGEGETLLIAGRNGSGKSTLVKILCGVLTPSQGRVDIEGAGVLKEFDRKALFGLVSPYLQLYDEFSALENLELVAALRGVRHDRDAHEQLLGRVALDRRRADPVRGYSSGMKQRLKYALALAHNPRILVLDEPMSNLDAEGMALVRGIMNQQRSHGILVVATNDLTDLDLYERKVDLNVRA